MKEIMKEKMKENRKEEINCEHKGLGMKDERK